MTHRCEQIPVTYEYGKSQKKKKSKVRIQTTISLDIYNEIIKKYLPEYGCLNALLEDALLTFDKFRKNVLEYGEKRDILLIKLVREVGMTALGFVALEHLSSQNPSAAIKENGLVYALEWFYERPIEKISLEEALHAIREIWLAANRVHNVWIKKHGDEIHVLFHSKLGPKSDELLCRAIKYLLEDQFKVDVQCRVFSHGYSLTIKKTGKPIAAK